jgi:hypothetical protein
MKCERCGEVNPAEIYTCSPQEQTPDNDQVICPSCTYQFRAIPVNVQQLMIAAGFEPPFTAPPKREWQGLTDEEIGDIIEASQITLKNYCSEDKQTEFARAIEAKLRRKNEQPCLF